MTLLLSSGGWVSAATLTSAKQAAAPIAARATNALVRPTSARLRGSVVYDWQSLGHDAMHTAYVNDPNMNVTVAPTLGVAWMTNLLSADLGGPVIAFNPTLNKTVAYAGDQRGNLSAFDETSGQTLWTTSLAFNASTYSTPLVSSDEASVWVGTTSTATLYKLNAATGAIGCTIPQKSAIEASPTEGTSSNGTPLVYITTVGSAGQPGLEEAYNESTCAPVFSNNPFKTANTGAVASTAYGTDANGRKLIFQGTTHPDSSVYALDATTGALVWFYKIDSSGVADVVAAPTVSAPGYNGFASGVVYVIGTNEILTALNLTTGAPIWSFDIGADAGTPNATARSSAALDGNVLSFGMGNGAYALNATTKSVIWHFVDASKKEVVSSPAIVGPAGQEVVAFADLSGEFHVLKLLDGTELYHYQTNAYVTASPAYVNGHFVVASTDGFLYEFAANGGNASLPVTTIASPTQGLSDPYASSVSIQGSASDAAGVNSVEVAVQSGGPAGQWYDLATNSWTSGAITNTVKVSTPGAKSSTWTFSVPVVASGSTFHVYANGVNVTNQADVSGAQVSFSVAGSSVKPTIKTTTIYIAPGAKFTAKGLGFDKSEQVSFSVAGATIGTATANSKGLVSASLTLPTTSPFGAVPFTATGATSHKTATAAIYVANAWLQAGNTSTHSSFEQNDPIFAQLMNPGGNTFLSKAWYYNAGSPVESSPAVYNAMTFFGDDAGTLTAVGTDTAKAIWTYTIPSKAKIRSTPAIDPATGDLTFTADDGVIYVVNASTGAPVTSVTVGGLLTSPSVASNSIVVGSDNDTLIEVNEVTGKLIWSHKLAGAIHTTPAFDPAQQEVVIGDDTGAITAFQTTHGLQLWQYPTGAAVTDPPTIANGNVYVGSGDNHFYAINELYGTKTWVFSAGLGITTGAAFDPTLSLLYVGLANGRLDALDANTGTLTWSNGIPGPFTPSSFVGVGAASSAVFATNSGGALTAFNSTAAGAFNADLQTGAALTTSPAINDGTVYVGANDGGVYAFTPYGGLPQFVPPAIRAAAAAAGPSQQTGMFAAAVQRSSTYRQFSWTGQRDVPIHADAIGSRTTASVTRYHGGPVQTAPHSYLIVWQAAGTQIESRYVPAAVKLLTAPTRIVKAGTLAGTFIDTAPYPVQPSDGAVQNEIARAIATNHWIPGINSQFIVLTANGALGTTVGFCSYHSAFTLGHDRSKVIAYGVVPYSGGVGACASPATFAPTGDPAIDALNVNLTRIRLELTHDPLLNGWYNSTGSDVGPAL